jgi:hypothetical protein
MMYPPRRLALAISLPYLDMKTTHILWKAAGQPSGDGDGLGICCICGQMSNGLSFASWVRDTFTDWDKILPGEIICHACQFAFAESSELLADRVGKDKPQRMRNYSHFVVGDEWIPFSKANKAQIVEILRGDFEIAIIADSGQKHIIFRAIPGVVQFEEQQVRAVDKALALLDPIQELYAGFSKSEIEMGQYKQHRIIKFGLPEWDRLEQQIGPSRGSATFSLALFLAQKGNSDDGDTREGGSTAGGNLAGNASRLQEPLPSHDLAAIRGQRAGGSLYKQPRKIRQLDLF